MSSNWLTTPVVSTAAGWTMLHLMWVGAFIGLIASLVRRVFRAARPEIRYAVALMCLLLMAVTPALIFAWVVEREAGVRALTTTSSAQSSTGSPIATASEPQPGRSPLGQELTLNRFDGVRPRSRLDSLAPFLAWVWLCGSACTLGLLLTGLVGVERLRRSARMIESGEIPRRCRALADSIGTARHISVGICDRLVVPALIGILRPMILLPPIALSGWSAEQLEMVLLHELAHLRRWDNLVNLFQRFVESLLFFHPVVWWLSGWIRLEREISCDRFVVERLGEPEAYAEMLVALSGTNGRNHLVVMAMADRHVVTRIRCFLNLEERSMKMTMPEGLGLLGAIAMGTSLIVGSQAAQTGAIESKPNAVAPNLNRSVDVDAEIKPGDKPRGVTDSDVRERTAARGNTGFRTRTGTGQPKMVPSTDERAVSLFARTEKRLEITQHAQTRDGIITYECKGGITVVSESPKFGTVQLEADEAVIVRHFGRPRANTVVPPSGETWVEGGQLAMEVHLKGNVLVRQSAKTRGEGEQCTIRADRLEYDFAADRVVAFGAELNSASPRVKTGMKIVAPRIEVFHAQERRPDGSFVASEQRAVRASESPGHAD